MLPFHGKFLLSKVVRCGTSQKKTPRDSTKTYSPRGLTFWDVPQIAAFHNKLPDYDALLHRHIHSVSLGDTKGIVETLNIAQSGIYSVATQ